MSEQNRPKGNHDQKQRHKREAVNALYFAVVEAIESGAVESGQEQPPIEVTTTGISPDIVGDVIAKFEGSGWNIDYKPGDTKLTATLENIDNSFVPKPPRPPYSPPQPLTPNPPIQPIYEPGGPPPPPTGAGPNPGTIPPVVPPGREPSINPNPSNPKAITESE